LIPGCAAIAAGGACHWCVAFIRGGNPAARVGPASTAIAAFEFAKARATGEKPNLGENRKVTVEIRQCFCNAGSPT